MTDLPHFAAPFGFGTDGRVNVVEQDSVEEIAACVFNIASCPVGALTCAPDFGVSDLMGATLPIDTDELLDEIAEQEPRAALLAEDSTSPIDGALRTIQLEVVARGGGNG